MRHLLTILDLKREEIEDLLDRARLLKEGQRRGIPYRPLVGKTLALLFEKPSTRTRVSFEVATHQLGGDTLFISPKDSQLGRGEPVKDTARVLSRYVDGVVIRTFGHEVIEEFAGYSSIPVINGLTDMYHPCQVLSDIFTIMEKKGRIEGLKIVWIGDGNNVAHSWINASARLGFPLYIATPEAYRPCSSVVERAVKEGGKIFWTGDPEEAVRDADVVNTDVWVSMGQDEERKERLRAFRGYGVTQELLDKAKEDCIFLHCLPAHRGEEVTEEVIEGRHSVVWDQAENRLHLQKALLEWLLRR